MFVSQVLMSLTTKTVFAQKNSYLSRCGKYVLLKYSYTIKQLCQRFLIEDSLCYIYILISFLITGFSSVTGTLSVCVRTVFVLLSKLTGNKYRRQILLTQMRQSIYN